MFKNSDTRSTERSQAPQHERAPVAYHQATGALLIKCPSNTFGRLFKSNAHSSQVGRRQISTNPQTLAKLLLTTQRKTREIQKPSLREPTGEPWRTSAFSAQPYEASSGGFITQRQRRRPSWCGAWCASCAWASRLQPPPSSHQPTQDR